MLATSAYRPVGDDLSERHQNRHVYVHVETRVIWQLRQDVPTVVVGEQVCMSTS